MSAVSRNVTPASSAAPTTARVPARSTLRPKLLQPRPTRETRTPLEPSSTCSMRANASGGRRSRRSAADGLDPCDRLEGRSDREADVETSVAGRRHELQGIADVERAPVTLDKAKEVAAG